jgi:predicted RNase H-like nuclease
LKSVEMKVSNVPKFRLRFPLSEVMYWAARYAYADDAEVEAIGEAARKRGWYTRDEFLAVARWKSPRSRKRCEENDETTVKAATQLAFSTADERQRIEALTQLHGVDYPTASVLLHLAHRDPYPIIDFRALWSLGVESPPAAYSFTFWWAYTQACRLLAKESGVRMWMFDRALWQYSKERRPPTGTTGSDLREAPEAPAPGETGESKSAHMRRMYAEGSTVVEVAKALKVSYGFAYGVHRRWLAQTEPFGQRSSGHGVPGRVGGAVLRRVLGIDGAEGGWFAVMLVDGYFAGAGFQTSVSALISQFPGVSVIAIDIPIGLPVGRPRPADLAARAFVGVAAAEFATLLADVSAASARGDAYTRAYTIARLRHGTGISRQTVAQRDRIREVAEIAAVDHRIVEVHPEVSFRALKGEPLRYSKKDSWSGVAERRALLGSAGIFLPEELPGGEQVRPDDVVDAAVAAWSAMRVAEGRSATLPAEPSGDPADGGVIHY